MLNDPTEFLADCMNRPESVKLPIHAIGEQILRDLARFIVHFWSVPVKTYFPTPSRKGHDNAATLLFPWDYFGRRFSRCPQSKSESEIAKKRAFLCASGCRTLRSVIRGYIHSLLVQRSSLTDRTPFPIHAFTERGLRYQSDISWQ